MQLKLDMLVSAFKFFRYFGFLPYSLDESRRISKIQLQKFYAVGVVTFLLLYWILLIKLFFENDLTSNKLTTIYNWIQLLVNGYTLNIILLFPLTLASTMDEIFKSFERFDSRAALMSIDVSKSKMNSVVLISIFYFMLFIMYMGFYEIYVILIYHQLTSWIYWLITFIPTVVCLAALSFAVCMLVLVFYRIQITINVLRNETLTVSNAVHPAKLLQFGAIAVEQSIRTKTPSIFHLYQEILDMAVSLEKFLGPIFLSAFTSIFVITTTQIYHCYTIIVSRHDSRSGFSVWSVILCANIIVVNISATIGLTTICEMIANQVRVFF